MEGLKFLGKPAPDNMSEDAWMDRCEHLEGAIKEAIELIDWETNSGVTIQSESGLRNSFKKLRSLLRKTIGERT